MKKKPAKRQKLKAECRSCARCCNYVCVEIDAPRRRADFEELAWLLAHRGVCIRVEKRSWYVLVDTPCLYLNKNKRCDIYEGRPSICKRYSPGTCDYNTRPGEKDLDADHIFFNLDELRAYRDERFPIKRRRKRVRAAAAARRSK
ncbi:MAG TPA: YkgJ family cysteine cluster protein [bacterium]|nr:YkgJ family cysteine cluster protein [bacterium]